MSYVKVLVGFFPSCIFLGGALVLRRCNNILIGAYWVKASLAGLLAGFLGPSSVVSVSAVSSETDLSETLQGPG